MRSFLGLFKRRRNRRRKTTKDEENVESPIASEPQPVPEPRAPLFEGYTAARREWAFAVDADGRRLDMMWQVVRTAKGEGCIMDTAQFLPFVRALRRACEFGMGAAGGNKRKGCDERSPPDDVPSTAPTIVTPACTSDARGIPAAVVRWLAEAVLSASICVCGQNVVAGEDSSAGVGCPSHGISNLNWSRVLPSEAWHDGHADVTLEGSDAPDVRINRKAEHARGGGGWGEGALGADGMEQRRVCLVEVLQALAAACRFLHTREELARQSRVKGGGLARGLSSLCDALRQVMEPKFWQGEGSRRLSGPKGAESVCFRREVTFFVRCLAPLVRIVTNSGPAGSTLGSIMDDESQVGNCLSSSLGVDNTCEGHNVSSHKHLTSSNARGVNSFAPFSAAEDMDEWSAMLVSGGVVRSFVDALQALVDARSIAREAGLTSSTWRARTDGKAVNRVAFGNGSSPKKAENDHVVAFEGLGCLGCELETVQVELTLALGTLLLAHPMATRGRFQLAGGTIRLYGLISLPKEEQDEVHTCELPSENTLVPTVPVAESPFLRERGLLLALRVVDLSLRGDSSLARVGKEKSAEVLGRQVEGYICRCERAAADLSHDPNGLNLLQSDLHGACALLLWRKRPVRRKCGGGCWSRSDGVVPAALNCACAPDSTFSTLQKVFREHSAFPRLLNVLEVVVAAVPPPSTRLEAPTAITLDTCSDVVSTCLSFFTALMARNSLGKNALRKALAEHFDRKVISSSVSSRVGRWADEGSFVALANLVSVVPAASLSGLLMEMMMDGECPASAWEETEASGCQLGDSAGDTNADRADRSAERAGVRPPEIRNPLVVPLIFRLLPDWPIAVQVRTMEAFRLLLRGSGAGVINRSMCCDVKPALMDQLLDMLPRLGDANGLHDLVIDLMRLMGSQSITVQQLKGIFRLLHPIPASRDKHVESTRSTGTGRRILSSGKVSLGASMAPLQRPWLCSLLKALQGMMDHQPGPQRFFVLDGFASGLCLPKMPRWPAPKGYTFCTWVRLEVPSETPNPVAVDGGGDAQASLAPASGRAPCLFSFAGDDGHEVAACFIPLRKQIGRGYERDGSAPQAASGDSSSTAATVTAAPAQQQYTLELRVGAGSKKVPECIQFPGAVVTAGEWTFVAVTHAPRRLGQGGKAATLVGQCWSSSTSPFPRFGDGGVVAASVGCHSKVPTNGDHVLGEDCVGKENAGRPVLSCLEGQMGPIYLFAGCLTEALLRDIRELGPDYAFTFEPPQVDSQEVFIRPRRDLDLSALSQVGTGDYGCRRGHAGRVRPRGENAPGNVRHKALDGHLTRLIFLAYNPSLLGGEYFLDNTPETNPVRWVRSKFRSDGTARDKLSNSDSCRHSYAANSDVGREEGADGESFGCWGSPDRRSSGATQMHGWPGASWSSSEASIFSEQGEVGRKLRPRPRPGRMHALRLPGTRECVRRDVRDALDCLGGVKVLLPLFAQYDHGVKRGGGGQEGSRVSFETDPRLNETVLALFAGSLRHSVLNQQFLRCHDGLSLVQHCLERVSPQHMTLGALTQACRLADRLDSWSEEWGDSAISCLLVPSRLWVFPSPEVQVALAGVFRELVRECPGRMRRVVGVQRCLDALDLYFWYTPPSSRGAADVAITESLDGESQKSSSGAGLEAEAKGCPRGSRSSDRSGSRTNGLQWSYESRQWVHPLTGDVLGVKATGGDLREIRARLLDAVILMACDGDEIRMADVSAALGFLRNCRDDSSRCEALRLILRLFDDPHQADRFAVASGYISVETGDVDGRGSGDRSPNGTSGGSGEDVSCSLVSLLKREMDCLQVNGCARVPQQRSLLPVLDLSDAEPPQPRPRARLVFGRRVKPVWWSRLWGFLSKVDCGQLSRRCSIPNDVLQEIATENPSPTTMCSSDSSLEIIRRVLDVEPPGPRDSANGMSAAGIEVEAPLTWDLMEDAFEPVSEKGAGDEAVGFTARLDGEGMLEVMARICTLEKCEKEADSRSPSDVDRVSWAVESIETRRVLSMAEAHDRTTLRRQAQWEAILKQVAGERGPWGRGVESADLDSIYWTLAPGEDDLGRRLKLVRNSHGSRHTIASERTRGVTRPYRQITRNRSRSSFYWRAKSVDLRVPDAAAEEGDELQGSPGQDIAQELKRPDERRDVRAMSAQTSLWHDLCKYQFKSYKAASCSEEEEDDGSGDGDKQDTGASTEGDGGGSWDGSRRGRRTLDPSRRAQDFTGTIFESQADVVRVNNKTPGKISLVGRRLFFSRASESSATSGVEGGKDVPATAQDKYRWALQPMPNSSWPTTALRRILFRSYGGMRFAALEMWFRGEGAEDEHHTEGTLLLGLPNDSVAETLHKALRRSCPPALEPFLGRLPATVLSRSKAGTWGASGVGGVGMFGPKLGNVPGFGGFGSAAEAARMPLTEAWVRRRCGVTNFDYLRALNAAAGRTNADLSRYPVFPWVLSERAWKAEELDLTDERNFRDFAWPVGAQRPEQREALQTMYQELERMYQEQQKMDGDMAMMAIPPFHHGSLYSSSAYVLWYLMRVEPFTSLHIDLQGGRFDLADRLFSSLRNPTGSKEAIPEIYYLPEIFLNGTGLDLGRSCSTGKPLGDVELPPWAHGDPWKFVRKHREALECEHVSSQLNLWIDLVFGYRQRPTALNGGSRCAVESCNVFFHLTYPGAVDLPRLREQDPVLYKATITQMEEFGQVPEQLFRSRHPRRLSLAKAHVVRPLGSPVPGAPETAEVLCYVERVSRSPVLYISDLLPWVERLVSVDWRRAIGYHRWRVLSPELSPPFRLRPDAIEATPREEDSGNRWAGGGGTGARGGRRLRRLGVPFAPGGMVSPRILKPPSYGARGEFGCSDDDDGGVPAPCLGGDSGVGLGPHLFATHAESRLIFSGGHWDSSFRATDLDSGRLVVSIARHRDVVTSLSLADGGSGYRRLVTASRDTTLMVWKVDVHRNPPISESSLLAVLYGHDTPVTCVCASPTLDTVVSSGEDGTVVVHTLWDGRYVRTITPWRAVKRSTASDEVRGEIGDSVGSCVHQGDKQIEVDKDARAGFVNGSYAKVDGLSAASTRAAVAALSRERLSPPWPTVEWVGISVAGYIVAYSSADATLRSYTVNGHALGTARVNDEAGPLRAFVFSEDGTVLVSGGDDRTVTLRWAHSLALADDGNRAVLDGSVPPLSKVPRAGADVKKFESAVRCLALTAGERHLFVGLEDGTLGILSLDADYLRQRLREKLDCFGI